MPLEFKKDILTFCKRYEELAKPRDVIVTFPKTKFKVKIVWCSDSKVEIIDTTTTDPRSFGGIVEDKLNDESPELNKINKDIKKFIEDTVIWGKKHFNNKDWLWENVLWCYRPEHGETHKTLKMKWVKL